MDRAPIQFDSPWKEALEIYLRSILEFCFPQAAEAIDWDAGVEFLDKELQEIVRDAALGEQRVDKLIKAKLRDGKEEWLLVHVEVQHQPDLNLPLRVYQYHHRVCDRFGRRVLTLVILADERTDWRPNHYEEAILGCRVQFDFPACKLLDLVQTARAAAGAGMPAAVIVLANWAAQQTRQDMRDRLSVKWDLTRRLYEAGLGRKDILELYRLIDWLLGLPEGLEHEFKQQVIDYEASKTMPYVTSIERLAREEGRTEGCTEGRTEGRVDGVVETVFRQLNRRWGSLAPQVQSRIRSLSPERLDVLAVALLDFTSPADLDSWLAAQ